MLEVNNNTEFLFKNKVIIKNISDEVFFMLDSTTGKQYDLTEMEYEILCKIDKESSFETIIKWIQEEYTDINEAEIIRDIKEYLSELIQNEIVIIK